jgi:hypothetical protein
MGRGQKYQPEQIVNMLRQSEVGERTVKQQRWPAKMLESQSRATTVGARSSEVFRLTSRGG